MAEMHDITAPLPGKVLKILVNVGDKVEEFQTVIVLEAMKMENEISAEDGGVVKSISVAVGDFVNIGQSMIQIEG